MMHRIILRAVLLQCVVTQIYGMTATTKAERIRALTKTKGMNVLMLVVDDLRIELNSYVGSRGDPVAIHPKLHTPSTDLLAKHSFVFDAAFSQYPFCGPSRASFLTSRRPDTTAVYDCESDFRDTANVTTLPQYFRKHGYKVVGAGKIFHPLSWFVKTDAASFDDYRHTYTKQYWNSSRIWRDLSDEELKETPTDDDNTAVNAIKYLREFKNETQHSQNTKPFFLAAGFHRPHKPWVAPRRFFDMYNSQDIKLADNPFLPKNFPHGVNTNFKAPMCKYKDIPASGATCEHNTTLPDWKARECRIGYYSSVSYSDFNVGLILTELEKLSFHKNTVVILVSDHGFHLGENMRWAKQSLFDIGTQVPFMIKVPGVTDGSLHTNDPVELVDLYPTVVDLLGLPKIQTCSDDIMESRQTDVCTEGRNLVPYFIDPSRHNFAHAARSQKIQGSIMGYSYRTGRYSFVAWVKIPTPPEKPDFANPSMVELYDRNNDRYQNINIADGNPDLCKQFLRRLVKGWRHELVESNDIYEDPSKVKPSEKTKKRKKMPDEVDKREDVPDKYPGVMDDLLGDHPDANEQVRDKRHTRHVALYDLQDPQQGLPPAASPYIFCIDIRLLAAYSAVLILVLVMITVVGKPYLIARRFRSARWWIYKTICSPTK